MPLEVELMSFAYMPNKREVSLIHPKGVYNDQSRIINISAQTAINLHRWLSDNMENLLEIAKEDQKKQ
jgi:hypothetical protein